MTPSSMKYDYSTKNFHRYQAMNADGTIREVYVPRAQMVQPAAIITVAVTVSDGSVVPEQAKPLKR